MHRVGAPARRRCLAALTLLCLCLTACSAGRPSQGFVNPRLMNAYIPLFQRRNLVSGNWGAAVALTPNVAVTNDHNLNFIPADRLIARSRDYDLLFFRTDGLREPPEFANAVVGEQVIAYGEGSARDLRESPGEVTGLDEFVAPRCDDCRDQRAIVYEADAGEGFSGGPVVDVETGSVIGITFGFKDEKDARGGRRMYAYDIALVLDEMRRLISPQSPSP
jgi:hypothetical protein